MNKKKKLIIGAGLGLLAIGALLTIYQRLQPLSVETLNIEAQVYQEYVVEEGTVEAYSSRVIYAPESEKLVSIQTEEGAEVKSGDILLVFDTTQLTYDLKSLEAQLESVRGQSLSEEEAVDDRDISIQRENLKKSQRALDEKKRLYETNQILFESGALSQEDLKSSEDTYYDALNTKKIDAYKLENLKASQHLGAGKVQYYQGQIEDLTLKIEQIENRIMDAEIRAPISGSVSGIDLNIGDYVNENSVLFELSNPDLVFVEAYVDTSVSKTLKVQDAVVIEVPHQNDYIEIEGQIKALGKVAEEIVSPLGLIEKKIKVLLSVASTDYLIVGEEVDCRFVTYSGDNLLVLSRDYVFPYDDGKAIWVIEEGQAMIRMIEPVYESSSKVLINGETASINLIVPPYNELLEKGIAVKEKGN